MRTLRPSNLPDPDDPDELSKDERIKQLLFALEEIEGRVMSMQEIYHLKVLRRIYRHEYPMEEMIEWRGKPLLHFKWNKTGELRTLKLYGNNTPPPPA